LIIRLLELINYFLICKVSYKLSETVKKAEFCNEKT
jgi:hypothetical protein